MAATFTIKAKGSQWTFDRERSGKYTGRTVYLILASEPSTPAAAMAAEGVPTTGGDYPGNTTGVTVPCVRQSIRADDTRTVFELTCEYDSSAEAFGENPLSAPLKVSINNEHNDETFWEDESDPPQYPIFTNGRTFDKLPVRRAKVRVITCERNVPATATITEFDSLDGTVNETDTTVAGVTYQAGTLYAEVDELSDVKTENGTDYRVLKFTLRAKRTGWDQHYVSRGKEDVDRKPYPVTEGSPNDDAMPLDEEGHFAPEGSPGFDIVLKPYAEADLSPLVTIEEA